MGLFPESYIELLDGESGEEWDDEPEEWDDRGPGGGGGGGGGNGGPNGTAGGVLNLGVSELCGRYPACCGLTGLEHRLF